MIDSALYVRERNGFLQAQRRSRLCDGYSCENKEGFKQSHLFLLLLHNRLVHDHSSNGVAIFLLLRSVNAVTGGIHGKAVYRLLNWKVFDFPKMLRIVLLVHSNDAAGAGSINAAQTGVELDYVCARR